MIRGLRSSSTSSPGSEPSPAAAGRLRFAGVAAWEARDAGWNASTLSRYAAGAFPGERTRIVSDRHVALVAAEDGTGVDAGMSTAVAARGLYACACSGRIDNVAELLRRVSRWLPPAASPAQIVLALYRRGSPDWAAAIVGDYVFAVWDPTEEAVVLGRDVFGVCPLFFRISADGGAWATELESLVDQRDAGDLDEQYIAGYLTGTEEWDRTPYRSIRAVTPGELVTIRRGSLQRRAFYELHPSPRAMTYTDAQEAFRTLFTEAVATRLNCPSPVTVELSGGLDSSSIVCVAAGLVAGRHVAAPAVQPVTYIYDGSRTSDERVFVRAVEEQTGLRSTVLGGPVLADLTEEGIPSVTPNPMLLFSEVRQVANLMACNGSTRLLSGIGGDNVLANGDPVCPLIGDLCARGAFGRALRLARAWADAERDSVLHVLWYGALWPMLPLSLRALCGPRDLRIPQWVPARVRRRYALEERLVGMQGTRGSSIASRRHCAVVRLVISSLSAGYYYGAGIREIACPFLHRPLVELLLGVPREFIWKPGESRAIQRAALRDVLPAKVLLRKGKRSPDEAILHGIAEKWPVVRRLSQSSYVSQLGWAEPKQLERSLARARFGMADRSSFYLVRMLSLEAWLRSVNRGGLHKEGR